MFTRNLFGAVIVLGLCVTLLAAGCRQQTSVPQESVFPAGHDSTKLSDKDAGIPMTTTSDKAPTTETASDKTPTTPADNTPVVTPPATEEKLEVTHRAEIKTARGAMEVELYGKETPITVENFVKLIDMKFYDGLNFHRVESGKGFSLIQGGDPDGNGTGGPGWNIKREISPKLRHWHGALAMARSAQPDSAGSQFYICRTEIPGLDGDYAVFGKVVKGLEVADKIQVNDKIISIRLKK